MRTIELEYGSIFLPEKGGVQINKVYELVQ